MNSSSHHLPSSKYFTFFYWNKTDKFISSALKHGRFIFEPSYSDNIHRLIRNINRVYFLMANIESHRVEAIIKLTDYKNDIMRFEHKTKCSIGFNEVEEAKEFKNKEATVLQRKLNVVYLPVFEAEVSEVYEREIEMIEDIRGIMKEKYRFNKKQQETLATYDKIKNTPLMYQLLNYHQMCYAMQKQMSHTQQGQLPSMFQLPGMLNYYQNEGKGVCGNTNGGTNVHDFSKYNSKALSSGINEPNLERYFDIKELACYNDLERRLRRDPQEDTSFYLLSNQAQEESANSSNQVKQISKEKLQKKRLSRSRSSHNNNNKTQKTKSTTFFKRSNSDEEGFYAKKMMTQNKKSKFQYSSNIQKPGYQQHQQAYPLSQSNSLIDKSKNHQPELQKRMPTSSFPDAPAYKTQSINQSQLQPNVNNQLKNTKFTTPPQNEVTVIDMSNRKKIILNRDKTQPEIRISFSNKYYK